MNSNERVVVRENAPAEPNEARKTEELRTWAFLSFVLAPLLAVIVVAGYGFVVWMLNLLTGPPTG